MIEKFYINPVSNQSHRTRIDHPAEASLASSFERTARSVDSELQSLVIEPRKFDDWWGLRACNSGDDMEAPQWSGVEARPGSENMAKQYEGLTGRWESLTSPHRITGMGATGLSTPRLCAYILWAQGSEEIRYGEVSESELTRAEEKDEGSLSILIVAFESGETMPWEPTSSQGECQRKEALR